MTEARVPVTVEDREAGQRLLDRLHAMLRRQGAEVDDKKVDDDGEIVQALAVHRLAGVAAGREEAAKVCDDLATTAANIQAALELVGSEAPTKAIQRETAETLAAAIRQMGGE